MRRASSEQAQHAGEPQEVQSILTCGTKPAPTSSSGASAASLQPPRWEGRTESWEPGPGRDFSSTKIIPGQKKQITVIVAGTHGTAGVRVKDACR